MYGIAISLHPPRQKSPTSLLLCPLLVRLSGANGRPAQGSRSTPARSLPPLRHAPCPWRCAARVRVKRARNSRARARSTKAGINGLAHPRSPNSGFGVGPSRGGAPCASAKGAIRRAAAVGVERGMPNGGHSAPSCSILCPDWATLGLVAWAHPYPSLGTPSGHG